MTQQYEALTNTEKNFVVILLLAYFALMVAALILVGDANTPCKLDIDENCEAGRFFMRLLPFYAITFSLNIGIVLSAYYINKLGKKSIDFFKALTVPPFIFLIYYLYHYGALLLRAFMS